ncbi:MAG: ATP-binding cassette domain-containing protein [Alphaproteobacteria bacterium]|nr:ATP-binding cassette domain-containing protein [Alphaproteobacteria bacterium]
MRVATNRDGDRSTLVTVAKPGSVPRNDRNFAEPPKRYGHVHAVRGVSFEIAAGTCVGLLGPHGAGKTTTMRMLLGPTGPSSGSVEVFGADIE